MNLPCNLERGYDENSLPYFIFDPDLSIYFFDEQVQNGLFGPFHIKKQKLNYYSQLIGCENNNIN